MKYTAATLQGSMPASLVRFGKRMVIDNVIDNVRKEIDHARHVFSRKKEESRKSDLRKVLSSRRLVPEGAVLDVFTKSMMEEEGIRSSVLPASLHRYDILLKKQRICGVGFENVNGGVEFYTPQIGGQVTIGARGLLRFRFKESMRSAQVCLFWNFMDYLSYREMMSHSGGAFSSDVIIINHHENFVDGMLDCECYDYILCFFPLSGQSNQSMLATVLGRNKGRSVDMSYLYKDEGFDSFSELIRSKPSNGDMEVSVL